MLTARLIREPAFAGQSETLGLLDVAGETLSTLELPWRENARSISCIPPGSYRCAFLERSLSGKYRNVFHVLEVESRGGILIHTGNLAGHTRGCILVGMAHGTLGGSRAVVQSYVGLRRLRTIVDSSDFDLEII